MAISTSCLDYSSSISQTAPASSGTSSSAADFVSSLANKSLGSVVNASTVDVTPSGKGADPGCDMDTDAASKAVAANPDHTKKVDLSTLSDREARKDFVANMTQLDGKGGGGQSCGPTALVQGMTMADPKSAQALASGILKQDAEDGGHSKMFNSKFEPEDVEALKNIKSGNASPADFQRMAQMMGDAKGVMNPENGTNVNGMGTLVADATKLTESGGGKMPDFEMDLFTPNNGASGGHWETSSNGTEIDPWANGQGKSTITDGDGGLAQGASHFDNGAVNTKVMIRNHGNNLDYLRFQATDKSGNRVNSDSQPVMQYHYTQDTIGYGYSRDWFGNKIPDGFNAPTKTMSES